MKAILMMFDLVITIIYWIISIIGCLVVIPCRVICAMMVMLGFTMWFSEGLSFWRNGMLYFVVGAMIYVLPVFLSVFLADILLIVKDKIYFVT